MRKFKNKSTLRKKVNSKWKILSYAKERQWEKNKPFKHLLKLSLLPIHEGSVLNTCWSALNTYTTFFDPTCPIQPDSFIPTASHCLKPSFHLPCSKASWIQMDAGPETAERGRPKEHDPVWKHIWAGHRIFSNPSFKGKRNMHAVKCNCETDEQEKQLLVELESFLLLLLTIVKTKHNNESHNI